MPGVWPSVPGMEGIYATCGYPFMKMYLWWNCRYPVFTRIPGGVNSGSSGLCCCVLCLLSAVNSLCLLIIF